MENPADQDVAQAIVPTDSIQNVVETVPPNLDYCSHDGGGGSPTPVLVELLRQVPPLSLEEPEATLHLFVRLEEIHDLGLVDDRVFIMRFLPLVSGSLLTFLRDCLHREDRWADCKSQLLDEYFPYFVRERLIRDLIVFNFQGEGQSLCVYIEQVLRAVGFLGYNVTEQQLVDRVVINFHPSILAQVAFLDKPQSLEDLYKAAALNEEKFSVLKEWQRVEQGSQLVKLAPGMHSWGPRAFTRKWGST